MTPRWFFMLVCALCVIDATIIGAGLGLLWWSAGFFALGVIAFGLALACRYDGWPTKRGGALWRARRDYR